VHPNKFAKKFAKMALLLKFSRPQCLRSLRSLTTSINLADDTTPLKPFSEIPGPKSYPFIGNLLGFKAPEVGNDPKELLSILDHLWKVHSDMVRIEVPFREPNVFYSIRICVKRCIEHLVHNHIGQDLILYAMFETKMSCRDKVSRVCW
jgi:hypothetical protein